jgi:hypothetical protein
MRMSEATLSLERRSELERTLKWASRRRLVARVTTSAILFIAAAFVAAMLMGLVLSAFGIEGLRALERGANEPQSGVDIIASVVQGVLYIVIILVTVAVYVALLVLPLFLTLPLTAPVISLWQAPKRFLLLRPFHQKRLSRPLRRVVRKHVAHFGHVYTLADADIRVRWYVRLPILFGQLSLFSFRRRKIRKPAQIQKLVRAAGRVGWRNLNWCLSRGKVFPVACVDACWKDCVTRMAGEADLILVDLSSLSGNLIWEVELCQRMRLEDRLLFLVSEEKEQEAVAQLRLHPGGEGLARRIFAYDRRGLQNPDDFRLSVAGMIVEGSTDGAGRLKAAKVDRLSVAATVLFSLGVYPLLAEPFLYTKADTVSRLNVLVFAYGLVSLATLLLAARRNSSLWILITFQSLLVGLAAFVLWG